MNPALYLVGATASGKKEVAREIAGEFDAELLGLDAMKVFRGLDRGTAKSVQTRFGLTDLVAADQHFSVGRYVEAARKAAETAWRMGRRPLFVGGTGLYLRALVRGLFDSPPVPDEIRAAVRARIESEGSPALHRMLGEVDAETAARLHAHDAKRIARALEIFEATGRPISEWQREHTVPGLGARHLLVGLRWPDEQLRQRITDRVDAMLASGLVEEVRALRDQQRLGALARTAIGYREVLAHLGGELDRESCREEIVRSTWRLSRRQANWMRQFPEIEWVEVVSAELPVRQVRECFQRLLEGPGPSATAR